MAYLDLRDCEIYILGGGSGQRLTIKVGDGNLTYTTHRDYNYQLDRGDLENGVVTEGDDVPMDVKLECVFETITTDTGEQISVTDALTQTGAAEHWTSMSSISREPYCVSIVVVHTPPCGTTRNEVATFPQFRVEQEDVDYKGATLSISGKCKVTKPTVSRGVAF